MKLISSALFLLPLLAAQIFAQPVRPKDDTASDFAQQAIAAYRRGDVPGAIALATKLAEAAPKQPQGWFLRAQLHAAQRDHAKAAADYSEVLKLDPKSANAWQARGEAHFKLGKITESIADFDKFLKLVPAQKPHHWQRGISLYYAARFNDGKEQYEIHRTVNPEDFENAAWHMLCAARVDGFAAAQKRLIPIKEDTRTPMRELHQLWRGEATAEGVLTAAASSRSGVFYGNLYLALFEEARGRREASKAYAKKAAELAPPDYMGDVARVHWRALQAGKLK